ncbi:MAG: DNA/RNA-binding protein Alba [Marine Group I thaumarchaeote]|nr:MAG: DNA/RNA-binding protein Alba [Marine Group I thaumarchaeote]
MSENNKPTEAEEIFSEFQKTKQEKQQSEQITEGESTPQVSEPTPEPEQTVQETHVPEPSPEPQTETTTSPVEKTETKERNVIFVGTKPIMTYVTATLIQLSTQPTVTIKARGKRITQAVDVSQMIVKRMNTVGYTISDVRIASDSLISQDGKKRNVSTMEIDITQN